MSLLIATGVLFVLLIVLGLLALVVVVLFRWTMRREPFRSKWRLFFESLIVFAAFVALAIALLLVYI
ncbi:MAG: hypothetical protein AAGA92_14490 [Planctomycetota bacterium]